MFDLASATTTAAASSLPENSGTNIVKKKIKELGWQSEKNNHIGNMFI